MRKKPYRHLSKFARLRLDLEDAWQDAREANRRADNAEREAYWKMKERFDLEHAALVSHNDHLARLICDRAALEPRPAVIMNDGTLNGPSSKG